MGGFMSKIPKSQRVSSSLKKKECEETCQPFWKIHRRTERKVCMKRCTLAKQAKELLKEINIDDLLGEARAEGADFQTRRAEGADFQTRRAAAAPAAAAAAAPAAEAAKVRSENDRRPGITFKSTGANRRVSHTRSHNGKNVKRATLKRATQHV